ncbi:hypothetical protein KR067_009202 [Drosophila pandora]|nr:hypothetical protein KR067_009202 [Drosophila pandora]
MAANMGRFFVPNLYGPGIQAIPTVVCSMELLQTLMCTPYNLKENWKILVNRYRNTTYMCLENPGEPFDIVTLQKRNNMVTVLEHVLYKGGEKHSESQPEALSQFVNVFFANISESITAVYEAPMGAACLYSADNELPLTFKRMLNMHYIDFKLGNCAFYKDHRHETFYTEPCYTDYDALTWWAESYLKKSVVITVACCQNAGRVARVKSKFAMGLPHEHSNKWLSNVCQIFLAKIMHEILLALNEPHQPETTYEFNYIAKEQIIYMKKKIGAHKYPLLPDWYLAMMETGKYTDETETDDDDDSEL